MGKLAAEQLSRPHGPSGDAQVPILLCGPTAALPRLAHGPATASTSLQQPRPCWGLASARNRWFLRTAPAERRLRPGQAPPSPAAGWWG